jgi:hypothetical protein
MLPRHVNRVGATGVPFADTRTVADTSDPAFGFAGVNLTWLALTGTDCGGGDGGGVGCTTSNLNVCVLFDRSGSGCSVSTLAVTS